MTNDSLIDRLQDCDALLDVIPANYVGTLARIRKAIAAMGDASTSNDEGQERP